MFQVCLPATVISVIDRRYVGLFGSLNLFGVWTEGDFHLDCSDLSVFTVALYN